MDIDSFKNLEGIPKIKWLASYPKSGNTWVRLLLYAYTFEALELDQIQGFITSDLIPGAWFSASPVPWGILTEEQKLLVRYTALITILTTRCIYDTILKTHCACATINSVSLIPNELTKCAVYILRDPRDVVISYANHMGKTIDESIEMMKCSSIALDFKETGIVQPTGSWSVHANTWLTQGNFERTIVKYEDLKLNTAYELKRILKLYYPDKEIDENRVNKAVELCNFERLKRLEEKKGFQEAPDNVTFFKSGKSTWRDVLTSDQIQKIQDDHGEAMGHLGYELV